MTANQLKFWGRYLAKPVVILVSGRAGVGKSTFARIAKEELYKRGYSVDIMAFAQGVKDCARQFFKWDGSKDERGRKLLQLIGTEVGRWYNPNIWVEYLKDHIKTGVLGLTSDVIIIDDWRFINEYTEFKTEYSFQLLTVHIYAPEREILRGTKEYFHSSEVELPNSDIEYDEYIDNRGDLQTLEDNIKEIIERRFK